MERRDPFNPMLKDLKKDTYESVYNTLDDKPALKITRDLLIFPLNLILMVFIISDILFDKIERK